MATNSPYQKGLNHYYPNGRQSSVTEEEKQAPIQRAKHSHLSLFFMGLVLFTSFFCIIAIMLEVMGFQKDDYVWPIALGWLASMVIFNFITNSKKVDDAISGKLK